MGFFWKQISESYGFIGARGEVNFFLFKKKKKGFEVDSWVCVSDNPPQLSDVPPTTKSYKSRAVGSELEWMDKFFFCNAEIQDRKKVFTDEVLETSAAMLWWGLVALFALEGSTFPAALIDNNYPVLWIWSWSPDFAGHRDFTVSGKSGVRCLNDCLLPRKSHSGAAVGWQQLWLLYFSFKLLCLAMANTARCTVHIPTVPRAVHLTARFFFFNL